MLSCQSLLIQENVHYLSSLHSDPRQSNDQDMNDCMHVSASKSNTMPWYSHGEMYFILFYFIENNILLCYLNIFQMLQMSWLNVSPHIWIYTLKLLFDFCIQPIDCHHALLCSFWVYFIKNVNERHCQSCLCFLTWWSCIMVGLYILFTKRAWEMTSPEYTGGPRAGVRPLLRNTWLLLLTGHHRTRSDWLTCQEMSNHCCPVCPLIAWNVCMRWWSSQNTWSFSLLVDL